MQRCDRCSCGPVNNQNDVNPEVEVWGKLAVSFLHFLDSSLTCSSTCSRNNQKAALENSRETVNYIVTLKITRSLYGYILMSTGPKDVKLSGISMRLLESRVIPKVIHCKRPASSITKNTGTYTGAIAQI